MTPTPTDVILSYGMGVDSTAILLRWALEPETRPDWENFAILTAMTGNEWPQTAQEVTDHTIPLINMMGWRWVQIARKGNSSAHGYRVLSDSTQTQNLFIEGDFKLSDELRLAGTVPQVGGTRKCSIKAKGEPLDAFIWDELGDRPYIHVMGFEANEKGRAIRDEKEGRKALEAAGRDPHQRIPVYPLIEWGWTRQDCLDYIEEHLGVVWHKSACTFCPFSMSNNASRLEMLAAYEAQPEHAQLALRLEHVSSTLNDRQTLIPRTKACPDGLVGAVDEGSWGMFTEWLEDQEHAVVEVKRVNRPTADDPTKTTYRHVRRYVKKVATGTRQQMLWELNKIAHQHQASVVTTGRDGVANAVVLESRTTKPDGSPAWIVHERDHLFVVVPVQAQDKFNDNFDAWWSEAEQALAAASQMEA